MSLSCVQFFPSSLESYVLFSSSSLVDIREMLFFRRLSWIPKTGLSSFRWCYSSSSASGSAFSTYHHLCSSSAAISPSTSKVHWYPHFDFLTLCYCLLLFFRCGWFISFWTSTKCLIALYMFLIVTVSCSFLAFAWTYGTSLAQEILWHGITIQNADPLFDFTF